MNLSHMVRAMLERLQLPMGVVLCVCLLAPLTSRAEVQPIKPNQIKYQITGLFQPDREEDLRVAFEKLPQLKLVSIDYPNAEILIEQDAAKVDAKLTPEKRLEQFDQDLRQASRGTFGAKPLRTMPLDKLTLIEITVAGLDCKACSYYAYDMVYKLPGVERATASFKNRKVQAWIDPEKTSQMALEEALKKGGVHVGPLPEPAK